MGKSSSASKKGSTKRLNAGKKDGPRVIAAKILKQVAEGRSLSDVLAQRLPGVVPKDRALVQELSYGVLRWWLRLKWIARRLMERSLKKKDQDLEMLILVGIYQILYMRVPTHAAVAETVDGAKGLDKPWATGLVNGVLRNLIRNRDELLGSISEDLSAEMSCPQWLLDKIREAWPSQWREILDAANDRPPMSLRVNLGRCTRTEYLDKLKSGSVTARPIPNVKSGLVLDKALDVLDLPGFKEGLVSVQDGGAQLAADLMDLESGQQLLDLCAAPGGKTCHILENAPDGIAMTAVDVSSERLQRVQENLDRLGLVARLYQGDAAKPRGEWVDMEYDRILLDVPCSATGVIRRHPDIKLLRRSEDIDSLVELQQQILESAWHLLKPGGVLLYVTCSLLPQENEEQIGYFLSNNRGAVEVLINESWGHARSYGRQTLPGEDTMDGFYYARIQKQS